jgi:hypothetical protein
MIASKPYQVDEAVREMERTIRQAIRGAMCVFEECTGLQPCEIEVHISEFVSMNKPRYEIDVVRCHLPRVEEFRVRDDA